MLRLQLTLNNTTMFVKTKAWFPKTEFFDAKTKIKDNYLLFIGPVLIKNRNFLVPLKMGLHL